MGSILNILPVSDLRQDAAVMPGVEAYEKVECDKEILLLLARGTKEIETDEGYDLDAVLAEAGDLLAAEPV